LPITEMQTLILWALLANEGGASFQKDVRPQVKKPDRDALAKEGLIIAENRGRKGYWLEATDRGWAWASEHLDAPLPKRSPAGSTVFRAWLTRLKSFMQAHEVALADILGPQRLHVASPPPAEPSPTTYSKAPTTYSNVRARVREAYFDLTAGRLNAPALLSELRDKLKGIDRDTLDETLRKMHLEEGTTLSGLNNPQEITQAVREAALMYKGEPMYVLWITR
jgi:hypothetical protein